MRAALALPLLVGLGSCTESELSAARDSVRGATEDLRASTQQALQAVGEVDLSAAAGILQERAAWVLEWSLGRLSEVEDSKAARQVAAGVAEVLDAASGLLQRAAGSLPNRVELARRVDELRARHAQEPGVMDALEPVLSRLSDLLGSG